MSMYYSPEIVRLLMEDGSARHAKPAARAAGMGHGFRAGSAVSSYRPRLPPPAPASELLR
jgi:hypothetical protein